MTKNNPKEIYDKINQLIDTTIREIDTAKIDINTQQSLATEKQKSLELLKTYQNKVSTDLNELQRLSEWHTFTIAMYGETNAGKSTIIEAMRILFAEPTKKENQARYKQLAQSIGIDENYAATLQQDIQQLSLSLKQAQQTAETIQRSQNQKEKMTDMELQQFQQDIVTKKRSFWFMKRWVYRYKKLDEERQLTQRIAELHAMRQTHQKQQQQAQQQLQELGQKLKAKEKIYQKINDDYAKLAPYQDGEIIGNGRSDFTLASQSYIFETHGKKFVLIDVPGIEGKENQVMASIEESVKKAHAVLYITPKAAPPNKGEGNTKGTLEKIKEHLSDQTEVWAIFNKRITNPIALNKTQLIDEGEAGGLRDLEEKLKEQLGKCYQGLISLTALPAFYAAATCILPVSSHHKARKKFVESIDRQDLLIKSNFRDFCKTLVHMICANQDEKIRSANKLKITLVLDHGMQILEDVIKNFRNAARDLERQIKYAHQELEKTGSTTASRINSESSDIIQQAKVNLRKKLYEAISSDIGNGDFEELTRDSIDEMSSELNKSLTEQIKKEIDTFTKEAGASIQRFNKNSAEILKINLSHPVAYGAEKLNLTFKFENGINTMGLITSIGGAALLIWNPAGWAIAAIGAVTLLFSFYKAVRSLFSSEYKMTQQRQSADENIANIFREVEKHVKASVKTAGEELQTEINKIKIAISSPLASVQAIDKQLTAASTELRHINIQLNSEY